MAEEQATPDETSPSDEAGLSVARKRLIGFIIVLALVNVAYRLIYATGVQQTAALFIGLPALLAIGLLFVPRSNSAIGMVFKGSLLATLLACVVLPEGLLCILFVLPLLFIVAVLVGGSIDLARQWRRRQGPTLMAVSLPLLILSLEGLAGSPFDPHDSVTANVTVDASSAEVAEALASTARFDAELPLFLRMGFNRPVASTGSGVQPGDQRTIEFTGGTHDDHPLRLFGMTGERGVDHRSNMHLTVEESGPGHVVFSIDHDTTMLARWADLERAVITWEAIDDTTTRVSWRLDYERFLYPTAYFAPLYSYGMDQAAGYLLDAIVAEQLR